jgi:hypothetical protein
MGQQYVNELDPLILIVVIGCPLCHNLRDGYVGISDDAKESAELFQVLVWAHQPCDTCDLLWVQMIKFLFCGGGDYLMGERVGGQKDSFAG